MKYNPDIHHRHSMRLKGYDYAQRGFYFVTICSHNRECLFGKIENGIMICNEKGQIVQSVWDDLPKHYHHIALHACVIMPNHVHGIIEISEPIESPESPVGAGFVRAGLKPAPTSAPTADDHPSTMLTAVPISTLSNSSSISGLYILTQPPET